MYNSPEQHPTGTLLRLCLHLYLDPCHKWKSTAPCWIRDIIDTCSDRQTPLTFYSIMLQCLSFTTRRISLHAAILFPAESVMKEPDGDCNASMNTALVKVP